jgi:hypothetical protein
MSKVKASIIESQSSSASEEIGSGPPKNGNFEEILGKRGMALWYKGHQSVINLFLTLPRSVGVLLTWAVGCQTQKTHKSPKNSKFQWNFGQSS